MSDTVKVAHDILAASTPGSITAQEAHRRLCLNISHQLQSCITTLERCRKAWPVQDLGTVGMDHLDRACDEIDQARDMVRAEAFPPPQGLSNE